MKKLHLGKFSIAILLAATIVTAPLPISASESPQVQIKTLRINIDKPLPGQAIQLPDEVPAAIRQQVLAMLANTPPGQAVVIAPAGVPVQYADIVSKVVKDAGVTLAKGGPVLGPVPLKAEACLGWILVVVVVIVLGVIIYVVWKCCQLLNRPGQTNAPPSNPYPAIAQQRTQFDLTQSSLSSTDAPSMNLDIEANTDLNTTNWWTLATLATQQAVDYTNGITSTIWSIVTARDTNGTLLASTLVTGIATNTLTGDRPLNIPYPGQKPDKLFLRLKAH